MANLYNIRIADVVSFPCDPKALGFEPERLLSGPAILKDGRAFCKLAVRIAIDRPAGKCAAACADNCAGRTVAAGVDRAAKKGPRNTTQ